MNAYPVIPGSGIGKHIFEHNRQLCASQKVQERGEDVARYAGGVRAAATMRNSTVHNMRIVRNLKRWLLRNERTVSEFQHVEIEKGLALSLRLNTIIAMRRELTALWARSMASQEELAARLQDWVSRAEASGIAPLVEFSRRLLSYA